MAHVCPPEIDVSLPFMRLDNMYYHDICAWNGSGWPIKRTLHRIDKGKRIGCFAKTRKKRRIQTTELRAKVISLYLSSHDITSILHHIDRSVRCARLDDVLNPSFQFALCRARLNKCSLVEHDGQKCIEKAATEGELQK